MCVLSVLLDVKLLLSWLDLLLCTNHTHRDYESLKTRPLQLYCCWCTCTAPPCHFFTAHTRHAHIPGKIQKRIKIHIHTEAPP